MNSNGGSINDKIYRQCLATLMLEVYYRFLPGTGEGTRIPNLIDRQACLALVRCQPCKQAGQQYIPVQGNSPHFSEMREFLP